MKSPATFHGISVFVSPDRPKYELPAEAIPGVPWPEGFRDDLNRWARDYLGTWNIVKDGESLVTPTSVFMNPRTYAVFRRAAKTTGGTT